MSIIKAFTLPIILAVAWLGGLIAQVTDMPNAVTNTVYGTIVVTAFGAIWAKLWSMQAKVVAVMEQRVADQVTIAQLKSKIEQLESKQANE